MRFVSDDFNRVKYVLFAIAALILLASATFSNKLARDMANGEKQKMDLWAEATRKLTAADENADYAFLLQVVEDNTSIPCLIVDNKNNVIGYRNIKEPNLTGDAEKRFWEKKIADFADINSPIVIDIDDSTRQLIYYDNSVLLKKLYYFPFVQLAVVILFFLLLMFFFSSAKKAEQNRVWVGLSKETAHQLGTPISSLMAWLELLKANNVVPELLPEIEKDVVRLQTIAERFSKVGSIPELKPACLNDVLENSVSYMRKRVSSKIPITCQFASQQPYMIDVCVPLFEWVVENLCKNAVDAMEGRGAINIRVCNIEDNICVDVTDTGKGIAKSKFKSVFKPGYTTKKRGWGLGLSLVKRIIEEYHHGSIKVLWSEVGKGTTFRITMKQSKDTGQQVAS